jgi:hypothetical protein
MKVSTRFPIPGREAIDSFLLQNFKIISGTHIATYTMGCGDLSLGKRRQGCEAGFKNGWNSTSDPCYPL